ncbi:MAG: hypothetical protein V1881_00510 [Candidatus Micrarchaeota archaeon]
MKFAPIFLLFACFSLVACAAQVVEVKVNNNTKIDSIEFMKVEGASLNGMTYTFDRALVKIHVTAKNGEGKKDSTGKAVADVGFTKSAVIVGMKLNGTGTAPEVAAGEKIEFSGTLSLVSFYVIGDERAYDPTPVSGKYIFRNGVIFADADLIGDNYTAHFDRYTADVKLTGAKKGDIRSLVIEFTDGLVPVYIFAYTHDGHEYWEWVLTDKIDVALGDEIDLIKKPDPYGLAKHIVRKIGPGEVPYLHTSEVVDGYALKGNYLFGALPFGVQLRFDSLPDYTRYDATSRTPATGGTQNPLKELPSSKQRAAQIGDTRTIRSGVSVKKVSFMGGSVTVSLSGVGAKDDVLVLLVKTVTRSPEFDLIEAVADYYGDAQHRTCTDKLLAGKSLLDFAKKDALTTKGIEGARTSALSSPSASKECASQYWDILSDCFSKKTSLQKGALAFELSPKANGEYWAHYKGLQPVADYFSGPNIYEVYVYVNKKKVVDGVYLLLQDLDGGAMNRVAAHGESSAHTYIAYAGQLMPTADGVMMLDCGTSGGCTLSVGDNVFGEYTSAMQIGRLSKAEDGNSYAMITAFGTSSAEKFNVYAPVGTIGTKKLSCGGSGVTEMANGNCFLVTVAA